MEPAVKISLTRNELTVVVDLLGSREATEESTTFYNRMKDILDNFDSLDDFNLDSSLDD